MGTGRSVRKRSLPYPYTGPYDLHAFTIVVSGGWRPAITSPPRDPGDCAEEGEDGEGEGGGGGAGGLVQSSRSAKFLLRPLVSSGGDARACG
ncbi:hypothetical protein E2C01_029130 [Portunus trituberculatus]|uniref:Uncharacterized protein n=1 Tax=Portunus trituberculatus TaxID=210409 RepID=A0A5B7EM97_PORTR|nr:hypothetical protein [Portunus trituberculatus]